jgi:hypothetical protein
VQTASDCVAVGSRVICINLLVCIFSVIMNINKYLELCHVRCAKSILQCIMCVVWVAVSATS